MKSARNLSIGCCALVASLAMISFDHVRAHGGDNWDPFTIDNANDLARGEILKVHALMANVILGRAGADRWPVDGSKEMRDALLTQKEVVDEILEHYLFEGVNVQNLSALHANPRAGRTAAASRALGAGISIIEYAATRDNADAFITEFYTSGLPARLFELLEVNVDRMDLYAVITESADPLRASELLPE